MKYISLIIVMACFLSSCSREFFFGEDGGADAFMVASQKQLVQPDYTKASLLPTPQEKQTSAGSSVGYQQEISKKLQLTPQGEVVSHTAYQELLKEKKIKHAVLDSQKFDQEMKKSYKKEKETILAPIDYVIGRDKKILDPITKKPENKTGIEIF